MSNRYNDEWLEAAKEQFEEAIEDGNKEFALDIIQDMHDAGFLAAAKEARKLIAENKDEVWQ